MRHPCDDAGQQLLVVRMALAAHINRDSLSVAPEEFDDVVDVVMLIQLGQVHEHSVVGVVLNLLNGTDITEILEYVANDLVCQVIESRGEFSNSHCMDPCIDWQDLDEDLAIVAGREGPGECQACGDVCVRM